jgi:hypothetical protein
MTNTLPIPFILPDGLAIIGTVMTDTELRIEVQTVLTAAT